jgi:hypothetical protein
MTDKTLAPANVGTVSKAKQMQKALGGAFRADPTVLMWEERAKTCRDENYQGSLRHLSILYIE